MYFYPRPPRGGRRVGVVHRDNIFGISIHALREEGDANVRRVVKASYPISIHALREEGDGVGFDDAYYADIFLSTPSARRATILFKERKNQK